jgi:uncharacterized membrane protein YfcA
VPYDIAIWLAVLIFLAAILYSSVGHGGASAYLAVMALFGVTPDVMKSTALVLNVLVATLGSIKFYRAGRFSWRLFWPFALTSVPLAFVGGSIALPVTSYRAIVGLVLLYAAAQLLLRARHDSPEPTRTPKLPVALVTGAVLGFLSGLIGVGGGIFLTPLLLLLNWAKTREAAGVSAPFILVNSVSGLVGLFLVSDAQVPSQIAYWAPAAVAGGYIGSELGSRRLDTTWLRRLLSIVLLIAGLKLTFT